MVNNCLGPGDYLPPTILKGKRKNLRLSRLASTSFKIITLEQKTSITSEDINAINKATTNIIIISDKEQGFDGHICDCAYYLEAFSNVFQFSQKSALHLIDVDYNLKVASVHSFQTMQALLSSDQLNATIPHKSLTAPLSIIPMALPAETADALIQSGHFNDSQREIYRSVHKSRSHITCDQSKCTSIDQILSKTVIPEVEKAFSCRIECREPYKICSYSETSRDFLSEHRDSDPPYSHRKFGLSIALNSDYEGGELIFPEYGQSQLKIPKNTAVVFSGNLLHAVNPVTKGIRWSLISFLFNRSDQRPELDYSDCNILRNNPFKKISSLS